MSYKFNPFTGKLDDYGPVLTGTGTVAAAGAGTAALPGIAFASDLNTGIYSPGADQVAITTGGTGRLFVTSTGLVGVGTGNPGNSLEVVGNLINGLGGKGSINILSNLTTNNGADATPSIGFSAPYSTGGPRILYGAIRGGKSNTSSGNTAGYLSFLTAPTASTGVLERLRINETGTTTLTSAAATAPFIVNTGGSEVTRVDSSGRLLVGTASNSGGALLQVNGDRIRVGTAKTPASATDTGTAGEICWDANYIYVCTATNTWKRTAITTWP